MRDLCDGAPSLRPSFLAAPSISWGRTIFSLGHDPGCKTNGAVELHWLRANTHSRLHPRLFVDSFNDSAAVQVVLSTIDGTGDALHLVYYRPCRSNLPANTSPTPTPQSPCGAPWERGPGILRYPVFALLAGVYISLHFSARRYADPGVGMRTDGNVRLIYIHNRRTLAHDLLRQGGIPSLPSERAYPGNDRCARSARAALRASPTSRTPPPSSPSLAARLPPSRASPRTRRLSSISSARRNSRARPVYAHSSPRTRVNGVRGRGGATDLDEVLFFGSSFAFFSICAGLDLFPSFIHTPTILSSSPFPRAHPPHLSPRPWFIPPSFLHRILRACDFSFFFAPSSTTLRASLCKPGPRRPFFLASPPSSSAHAHRTPPPFLTGSSWRLRLEPTLTHRPSILSPPTPPRPFSSSVSLPERTTLTSSLHRPHPAADCAPLRAAGPPLPPAPLFPLPPPPETATRIMRGTTSQAAHEGKPEAQAQHFEDYDARSVLEHHCTTGPFSADPLLMPATGVTHCGKWAVVSWV
ncbi:hypothetical protein K438DRAFT_2000884 [Mycena galopus ATCC 62051]|nr:hypothetical protein K438DRAFT_2000884 [Mycena galopus ATCC 62051]